MMSEPDEQDYLQRLDSKWPNFFDEITDEEQKEPKKI